MLNTLRRYYSLVASLWLAFALAILVVSFSHASIL